MSIFGIHDDARNDNFPKLIEFFVGTFELFGEL